MRAAGLVDVTWLPFELHPEVPREGMPRERLLPPDYIARVRRNVDAMAHEVGLVMRTKDRLINTRLALATAEFARERGMFEPVHRALFTAHWEGTAEIDRLADLQRIAAEHGLDPDELGHALADGRYEPVIDRHRADAASVGIDAIPSHIVGGRYLLVGAQPVSVFMEVLERIAAEHGERSVDQPR
ncbi:MAG: DsbA family protein [Chloroflexi bacterium]|nr:DsbA family protein [Chloroflexota bacterium]